MKSIFLVLVLLTLPSLQADENSYFDLIHIQNSIQALLPTGEGIKNMDRLEGGFSNNLWKVDSEKKSYIFRSPMDRIPDQDYIRLLDISKHAFNCGTAPQLVGEDSFHQHMLLEYIENAPWPSWEENPAPYKAAMRVLRCFHENMKAMMPNEKNSYAPFSFILDEAEKMNLSEMPVHLFTALERTKNLLDQLKPWLEEHATICHGDFHQRNVLLPALNPMQPKLIDFDSAMPGDPLFDVVKFSIELPHPARLELLYAYLGRSNPTQNELDRFEYIDRAMLMVIAINRFKSSQNGQNLPQGLLSRLEMEEILNSNRQLPSFNDIPFKDTSANARQLGAVYALAEFLRRSM